MIDLQAQLDQLKADRQEIERGIQQKSEQIDRLAKELEQHRGVLSYNQLLQERVATQLAALHAKASAIQAAQPPATTP